MVRGESRGLTSVQVSPSGIYKKKKKNISEKQNNQRGIFKDFSYLYFEFYDWLA